MDPHEPPRSREDFDIAVICALQVESDAVEGLFDEIWPCRYGKASSDPNAYTLGRMGRHNTVLAFLPGMGKESAASAAASLLASFPRIRLGLVVGVCGGVPINPVKEGRDIFLGDVIISTGIVQYDLGRRYSNRFVRKDTLDENLGRPTKEIRSFLRKMSGIYGRKQLTDHAVAFLRELCAKEGFEDWDYPGVEHDQLYASTYRHKHQGLACCDACTACIDREDDPCDAALGLSCALLGCDERRLVVRDRSRRPAANQPGLHFGHVASGDTVMKSAHYRDDIARRENVVGFEMEGAGVWDMFPTVVIKGVCDYADSHKMKDWQKYAAAVAAATMKALLTEWAVADRSKGESGPIQPHSNAHMPLNDLLRLEHFMAAVTRWQRENIRPSENDSAVEDDLQRLMRQFQAGQDGRQHQASESSTVFPRSSMITAEQTFRFIHRLAENMHNPFNRSVLDTRVRDILVAMGSPSGTPKVRIPEPPIDRRPEASVSTLYTYQAMTVRAHSEPSSAIEVYDCLHFTMVIMIWTLLSRLKSNRLATFLLMMLQHVTLSPLCPLSWRCVKFEDALGRVQKLPFELCRDLNAFDAFLKDEFQGRPGHQRVLRGDYMIVSGRFGGSAISRQEWLYAVEPGCALTMAVSIVASGPRGCPRCGGRIQEFQLQCQICFRYCQMRRARREILDVSEKATDTQPQKDLSEGLGTEEISLVKYICFFSNDIIIERQARGRRRVMIFPFPGDQSKRGSLYALDLAEKPSSRPYRRSEYYR